MLGTIVKKEFLGNLTSLRFVLTFLLVVLVFIVGSVTFVGKHEDDLADFTDTANKNLAELQKSSAGLNLLPYQVQTFRKKPLAAQLFSEGAEKDLPNTFRADVFTVSFPETESRANFLFPPFADIDWAFIIAFILSFVAVLMTFDALAGERQRGTLSLMMSNAVPRDLILIGKYLGGLLTLAVPFFTGLLLSVIIVSLGGVQLFRQGFELKVVAFLFLALIYLSVFVLLGLLVSGLSSRPSNSVMVLLVVWVMLTILIPSAGRIAAEKFVRVPTRSEIERQIKETERQIFKNSERYGKNSGNWGRGLRPDQVNPSGRAAMLNDITKAKNLIKEEYINKIVSQVMTGRNFTRISPTALFQYAGEAVMGTGVSRFRYLLRLIKRYQTTLAEFISAEDKKDSKSLHLLAEGIGHRTMLSERPVDYNSIPKYGEKPMSAGSTLKNALWDAALLAVMNILLAMGVYTAFLRADIRPK